MAITKAIFYQLFLRQFLPLFETVSTKLIGVVERFFTPIHSPQQIPTLSPTIKRDALLSTVTAIDLLYKRSTIFTILHQTPIESSLYSYFPLRFYKILVKMGDNIRRAIQDINLGVDDEPIRLPIEVVAQAAEQNRFILMGRPVIPRRQNIRAIIANLPRSWGLAGVIHGRIVAGGNFQFIFPTEEAMENVLRRGPWAYNDRMLILQQWTPLMNPSLLNFIPFWVQIRGIPYHLMNEEVIAHVARAMGQLMEVDYNAEAAAHVEFVRVRLNWDVASPLRFQRHFQFADGVNTLLRFRYERLRGFCEVCGMLTHDSGNCLIQNGGEEQNQDGDDDEDMDDNNPMIPHHNHGVVIREMIEGEEEEEADVDEEGEVNAEEQESLQDALLEIEERGPPYSMFNAERETNELFNPIPAFDNATGDISGSSAYPSFESIIPRLEIMDEAIRTQGTIGAIVDKGKRKREESPDSSPDSDKSKMVIREKGESSGGNASESEQVRGAVGPEPPLPP